MAAEPHEVENYFNYFTEVEEHFQKARGTSLFLMSPLDWALVETWKDSGVPLAAVLRGIDSAFENWRSRKKKFQSVNSLAYCAQAVMKEAQVMAGAEANSPSGAAPFTDEEVAGYLARNAEELRKAGFDDVAASLEELRGVSDLESLEQHLAALEDKLLALARTRIADQDLLAARQSFDSELRMYRSKMSAPQLAMLEKQYLDRYVLEQSRLPRLSLFYLK
jgi:hypothetical protein